MIVYSLIIVNNILDFSAAYSFKALIRYALFVYNKKRFLLL